MRPVTPAPARVRARDVGDGTSHAGSARFGGSLRRTSIERRTALVAVGLVIAVWLLVVFAGALADASEQAARLAREQAVNDALTARVVAGSAEVVTIQERSFLEFMARSYGMGQSRERPFSLAPGAPPAPLLVPLGQEAVALTPSTPLEDWLDLLIGA